MKTPPVGAGPTTPGGNGASFALVRWYEEPDVVFVITSNAFDPNQIRMLLAGLVRLAVEAGA